MMPVKIKVCGITGVDDARICCSLGVDYLGIVFAESSRKISLKAAKQIRTAFPRANLVGVFADSHLEFVARTAEQCGLDLIQLHGRETPNYCKIIIRLTSTPVIKAFSPSTELRKTEFGKYDKTSFFLFDLDKTSASSVSNLRSHTALEKLWLAAAEASGRGYTVFLAGSLNTANVRRGIETVKPFCVDVCSSVESKPGVKDKELVKRFILEVKT